MFLHFHILVIFKIIHKEKTNAHNRSPEIPLLFQADNRPGAAKYLSSRQCPVRSKKFASPKGCIGQDLKPVRRNLGQKPQTFDFIYIQVVAQSSRHIHTGQIFHPDSTVFQQEGNACCDGQPWPVGTHEYRPKSGTLRPPAENLLPFIGCHPCKINEPCCNKQSTASTSPLPHKPLGGSPPMVVTTNFPSSNSTPLMAPSEARIPHEILIPSKAGPAAVEVHHSFCRLLQPSLHWFPDRSAGHIHQSQPYRRL